jgi:hypothetical protein
LLQVVERLKRQAWLHTDNFLRCEAEEDWEEERATLLQRGAGGDTQSIHARMRAGSSRDSAAGTAGAPVAGFTERELAAWHRDGSAGAVHLEQRWRARGRFMHLAGVVEDINRERWGAAARGEPPAGDRAPLQALAAVDAAAYAYPEPRSSLVAGTPARGSTRALRASSAEGTGSGAEHGDASGAALSGTALYLRKLNLMLHEMIVHAGQPASQLSRLTGDRERAAWLLRGALRHLHVEFRAVLTEAVAGPTSLAKTAVKLDFDGRSPSLERQARDDRALVRAHLARYLPREWQVSAGGDEREPPVPRWAETLFLLRVGSAHAPRVFEGSAQGEGGQHDALMSKALRVWVESEADGGRELHRVFEGNASEGEGFAKAVNPAAVKGSFRKATGQDIWFKAVVSLLNDTADPIGDMPRRKPNTPKTPSEGAGRAQGGVGQVSTPGQRAAAAKAVDTSYWAKRAINDLPPLLGDPMEQLCHLLGRDPACDKLLLPEFLEPSTLSHLGGLNSAAVMQRALWRLVQDHLWRQLAAVRPDSAFPVLSLEHCQVAGIKAVVDALGRTLPSFKAVVRHLTSSTPMPEAVPPATQTIVTYNIVQILFLSLQIGKGVRELARLGGVHLAEAAHTAIALHYHSALAGGGPGDNWDDPRGDALVSALTAQLLHSYVLPTHSGIAGEGWEHMSLHAQAQRALHYCLVLQPPPDHAPGGADAEAAMPGEDALAPAAVELVAQVALAVPARALHEAFGALLAELVPDGPHAARARRVLALLMRKGRRRAAEVCCARGEPLLHKDAAVLYYWAEKDAALAAAGAAGGAEVLELGRYLQTVTALVDLYASPGRTPDKEGKAARARVMDFASRLVREMDEESGDRAPAPERLARGSRLSRSLSGRGSFVDEEGEGGVAAQARDAMRWLRRADAAGAGAGARTRLAALLHTWQMARAQDVLASGMPLEALRELLDLPSPSKGARKMQIAPLVHSVMAKAFAEGRGGAAGVAPRAGNMSFLPSLHHGVKTEQAVAAVEAMVALAQHGAGERAGAALAASRFLVPDALILALQCFLALQRGGTRAEPGRARGDASVSMRDVSEMLSPPKRHRPADPPGGAAPQHPPRAEAAGDGADVSGDVTKHVAWHVEEIQRLVDTLVARNLVPHDLQVHVRALRDAQSAH